MNCVQIVCGISGRTTPSRGSKEELETADNRKHSKVAIEKEENHVTTLSSMKTDSFSAFLRSCSYALSSSAQWNLPYSSPLRTFARFAGARVKGNATYVNRADSIPELCSKQHIRICKHALLQTDYNKLASLEAVLEELANILCVIQIQGCIDFIENVHRGRLELEQRHYQ